MARDTAAGRRKPAGASRPKSGRPSRPARGAGRAPKTEETSPRRMSADERRREIVAAALSEFARTGLHGTSTETIARRVGVSQPYLFRLFGTKRELFLACCLTCFERIAATFSAAAEDAPEGQVLPSLGRAYIELLADRELLLMQMQMYAACEEPEVRAAIRPKWGELYVLVERVSGAPADEVQRFIAHGMLLNVAAALELDRMTVRHGWARRALGLEG